MADNMTTANHLERLAETLTDALSEMEDGKLSASKISDPGVHAEWCEIFTRLRNLRSIVVDKHQSART